MDLHTRKRFTALDEDNEPLDDVPPQILDKQVGFGKSLETEQQEQVQQLVKLARDSQKLYRNAVSLLQTVLLVILEVKKAPSPSSQWVTLSILSFSILRSILLIPLPPHFPPIPFNLALSVPLILHAVYLYLYSIETGWEQTIVFGLAPLGAILLRVGTEWEGERAVEEAKSLEKLMYDSPEA
ncbi:hypothetical protein JCM5350_005238 [Sporobolomyces pararoseus]